MRTSCLQPERIKRIEVDQDPLTIHGKKGCFDTVKIELEELEIQKTEESLAKPSTFLWFHHIYAYFISILRGVLTLDGCHWAVANHIETRKLMPTRTRTPSFASGATERQEIFSSSLTSLRGATKQRWRHPPGDPNFAGRFGFWMHAFFLLFA